MNLDNAFFIERTNEIQDVIFGWVDSLGPDPVEVGDRFDFLHSDGYVEVEDICDCCNRAAVLSATVPYPLDHDGVLLVGYFDIHDPDEIETVRWEWIVPAYTGSELTSGVA